LKASARSQATTSRARTRRAAGLTRVLAQHDVERPPMVAVLYAPVHADQPQQLVEVEDGSVQGGNDVAVLLLDASVILPVPLTHQQQQACTGEVVSPRRAPS
jgi:hypothetical protein